MASGGTPFPLTNPNSKKGHEMEWQPIETAPRDGTYVLLYWPRGDGIHETVVEGHFYTARDGDEFWWAVSRLEDRTDPTHWLPLPAPPKV